MGADNKGICRKEDALKVVGGDGLNKELLEQALLELTPLLKFSLGQGNHVVDGAEAVGDLALLRQRRKKGCDLPKICCVDCWIVGARASDSW